MNEYFMQFRADQTREEMRRDAAARRMVRGAGRSRSAASRVLDLVRARAQRRASTAFATSRTPSSISEVITCP
jgi:hypothetical protein